MGSYYIHSQGTESDKCLCTAYFFLFLSRVLARGVIPPIVGWVVTHQLLNLDKSLIDMSEVCLLDNFRSCEIDSHYYLSQRLVYNVRAYM